MPAPDLYSLYAFEEVLEPAVVTVLSAQNVPACRQRDGSLLGTPRVEVSLWMGAPTGKAFVPTGAHYTPGQTYPSAFHGKLVLTVVTNRKGGEGNAGRHAEFLARCRVLMLLRPNLLGPLMPLHRLNQARDAGVHPSTERDTDLDVSPLIFEVQIEILASAWPLATP